MRIRAGIVGGSGYTGVELLRLLMRHPGVEITVATSRADAGKRVDDTYPNLRGGMDLHWVEPDPAHLVGLDVVFFATPHGVAMSMADELLRQGVRLIDLSADFRLSDAELWSQWYGHPHTAVHLLAEAVYALPETSRQAIRTARLVACPGCYPTAVQLAVLPALEAGLIKPSRIIADVKSGVSGAGRKAEIGTLMSETGESFKAYGVAGHRHEPEISQQLQKIAGQPVGLTFVPHLVPMIRGIHATVYADWLDPKTDPQSLYEQRYRDEPFVDVLPPGSHPDTRNVRGSNRCQIAVHRPGSGQSLVILSVIDNLTKGASGQAVQAMNIMFGFEETTALDRTGLYP
ncbi:MAG: N-acetyl-gamma-glutamyl-phosphate reductase [Methylococcaceae bacterium]